MAVSLAIFALLYLTVIKPSSDTANQAVKAGLQQSQQALNQAQKQLSTAGGQVGQPSAASGQAGTAAGGQVSTRAGQAVGQAQQQLGQAARLTACVTAAGTDAGQIQACETKFGH